VFCQYSIQLDNQPSIPLRTQQQDHFPTHHPTVISSTTVSSTTALLSHSTLAHDVQVEPLPAPDILGDLSPFLRAGGLALITTSHLVLLVEDNSNDSTVLGEQQSQLTSYQRRKGGARGKEREWPMGSQSSYLAILLSRVMPRVPQLRSLHSPVTTSAQYFQKGYSVHIYRAWSIFLILSMCPSTVHLADTRPQSPSTLGYESIHTSFIGSTHAIYREADHALKCAYRFLLLPICPFGSHNITPSHCSFLDDALNPPSSPPPRPRRHVFVASIAVSTSGHHYPPFKHHPRFIILD